MHAGVPTHIRNQESRFRAAIGAVGLLALHLACGGGSTGSTSTPPVTPPSSTPLAGRTAKGIIQKGVVTAYEWSGGAWVKRGEATTDSKGDYALSLTGYTGQGVKLVLTATTGTTMIWDGPTGNGHTFGQAEPVPTGFSMQAILPAAGSNLTNVPVTPYTSMAAALADASGTKDATSIQKAIATINAVTGFDVSCTKVLDITDPAAMQAASPTEQRASAMTAAIAFIPGKTIPEAVAQLSQSAADGRFDASDPIGAAALTSAWTDALANPGIANQLSDAAKNDIQVTAQTVDAATANGVFTPVPPVNPPATEVAAAKGLISDVRSLISNVIQTDFQSPLGALGSKVEAAGDVFGRDAAAMVQLLGTSLDGALTQVGTAAAIHDGLIQNGSVTRTITLTSGADTLGTMTLMVSNPKRVKIELNGSLKGTSAQARTVTVNATIDTGVDLDQIDWNTLTTKQTSFTFALQAGIGDGVTSLSISKGTVSADVTQVAGGVPEITSLALKDLTLELKTDKAAFTGACSAEAVRIQDGVSVSTYFHDGDRLSVKKVGLSGTFALNNQETFKASVGIDLANADQFDLMAFLNRHNEFWLSTANAITPAQVQAIQQAAGLANASGSWTVSYAVQPWGSYAYAANDGNYRQVDGSLLWQAYSPDAYFLNQFKANPGAQVTGRYVRVDKDGSSIRSHMGAQIQLRDTVETSSHFLQVGLTMAFELSGVTGLPAAKVALAVNRSALKGGSATFGFTWGTRTYTFSFADIDLDQQKGSLTVANGQGVSLQLKDINAANVTGALYVGATKVAEVKQLSNGLIKVSYSDGTFETLQ